jgi:hypothetical protein
MNRLEIEAKRMILNNNDEVKSRRGTQNARTSALIQINFANPIFRNGWVSR